MEVTWQSYTCRHREDISGLIVSFHDIEPVCEGSISFCNKCRPQREVWTIEQLEPLTISPSIRCKDHSHHHGWIRNGKWIPA